MRKHRTTHRPRRIVPCHLCNRPVDLASGYAFDPRPGVWVHPHCQAYELEIGPIPTGARVLQTCESPTCCNPAHLVLLTAQAPTCEVCGKPVDTAADCWRANRESAARVHVLCLAATFVIEDSPSALDYEVADRVNEQAAEICRELCENPAHRGAV